MPRPGLRSHPSNLIRVIPAKGAALPASVPRALTIAASDSGGAAGIQAGRRLLQKDAVDALVTLLFPLARVITPNLHEAIALAGDFGSREELAAALHDLGARAVVVTGGHGDTAVDLLFDGDEYLEIPVERLDIAATHGAGCTHSATLAALLARGETLEDAARGAARAARNAVRNGLVELGAGEGPVDVLGVRGAA